MGNYRQTPLNAVEPYAQQPVQQPDSIASHLVRWVRPHASQVLPFVSATPHNQDWQQLTQVILNADHSQDGIRELCKIIGTAFNADCCFIAQQSQFKATAPTTCWAVPELAPLSHIQTDCFDLLQQPAIASQWQQSDVLAIADLAAAALPPAKSTPAKSTPAKSTRKAKKTAIRSLFAIHTELYQQVNGMIVIGKSQPYDWQDSDVMLLQNLSPQVAIALSQMQLEQQVQQQMQYQNLHNQLTTAIRNSWDLQDLFELATEGTAIALQASRGLLISFKYPDLSHKLDATANAQATLICEYPKPAVAMSTVTSTATSAATSAATSTETAATTAFSTGDCLLLRQLLLQKTEPIILPQGRNMTEIQTKPQDSEAQAVAPFIALKAFPSLLMVPIENQGTVLGCLVLQHHQPRLWSVEECSFIQLVAAQLSTAIIQNRTLQQVQSVVTERTAQLQRSLKVQAKLYEKTRQQIDQLRHLDEERERFLGTISHELLTPLTSMRLAIQMLRNASLSPDRAARYLDILEQQCNQETQLINDMLALRKLETEPSTLQHHKVDLNDLINDVADQTRSTWQGSGLRLVIKLPQQPLWLYSEPDRLTRVLVELLANARKYARPNSFVTLQVDYQDQNCRFSSDAKLIFTIINQGYGIQTDEIPFIFDKFRRGEIATKQAIAGTGLGLALVKSLVAHLNGAIAVTSQPLSCNQLWETCFTMTFAQFPDGLVLQSSEST